MITPAFGPVEGAAEHHAAANMTAFMTELRERATVEGEVRGYTPQVDDLVRDESLDADGRYGWTLQVNGQQIQVLMPGVDEATLRGLTNDVPALIVNGGMAWWNDAVGHAIPIPARQ